MGTNVPPATATREATSRGSLLSLEMIEMEETRRRERRRSRHTRTLAHWAISEAGTPTKVGQATGHAPSTVAHWTSDRVNPAIRDFFELLVAISRHPELDADAILQAAEDAVAFDSLVMVSDERLLVEGLELMDRENRLGYQEDLASLSGVDHDVWLRRVARSSARLSRIIRELRERGIDLHAEYRARRVS